MNTLTDCAYLAGMIDGEGCINISKRMPKKGLSPSYRLELIISNNYRPCMEELAALWGGSLHNIRQGRHTALRMGAKHTEAALAACLPFLRIKGNQARLALAFYATFSPEYSHPDIYAVREQFRLMLMDMHQ